jgi:hypothetical protein
MRHLLWFLLGHKPGKPVVVMSLQVRTCTPVRAGNLSLTTGSTIDAKPYLAYLKKKYGLPVAACRPSEQITSARRPKQTGHPTAPASGNRISTES